MAISVHCACGKVMRASEELAGRKVKCSACAAVLLVPEQRVAKEEDLPSPIRGVAGPPPLPELSGRGEAPRDSGSRRQYEPIRQRQGMAGWIIGMLVFLAVGVLAGGGWLLLDTMSRHSNGQAQRASQIHATNNMKQMLLAMHAHHDVYKKFPTARSKSGLSWRVAILPYIEQDALHRRFHLDEPWDSPHNIKLLDEMPEIYKPVSGPPAKPGHTCYQVFSGDKLIFHPTLDLNSRIQTIADGSSNTILIVEASDLVPWTAPQDIRYQPFNKDAPPRLGYQRPDAFLVGMGDASTYWLTTGIPQEMLDRLIAPNDGNVVELDRFFAR